MEFGFKEVLFGLAGVSMIAWIAIIGLWHTFMFPTFFKEDAATASNTSLGFNSSLSGENQNNSEVGKGQLRPLTPSIGLINRNKYSRQSIVLADFNPVESGYNVNRLYTVILLGLGITSFVLITYGLQSGFNLI